MVDGEPMTLERRSEYFRDGVKYMLSPEIGHFVQRAFLYEMQNTDLSEYDFQANIPGNDLRAQLSCVADEDAYLDEFVQAWSDRALYYWYRDEKTPMAEDAYGRHQWFQAKHVWQAFTIWANDTHIDTHNCRSAAQLAMKLMNRGLVGEVDSPARLWRKVGHGNARVYCLSG